MIPPPQRTVLILALAKPATLHVAEASSQKAAARNSCN
jgi:hypothetical protein